MLFNIRGIAGASMADVSEATGLEKGGVYNHFATKEELSVAAFEYAAALVRERIETSLSSKTNALERLRAFLDTYRSTSEWPLMKGGCPLMNTAIEADDTNPELRRRAKIAIEGWRARLESILEEGVRREEIRPVDCAATASAIVATVEGAVMLAKVYGDRSHLDAGLDHLENHLGSLERRPRAVAR